MVIQGLPAAAERLSKRQVLDAEALNAARLRWLDDLPHWPTMAQCPAVCETRAHFARSPTCSARAICRSGHQTRSRTSATRSLVAGLQLRPDDVGCPGRSCP